MILLYLAYFLKYNSIYNLKPQDDFSNVIEI